MGPATPPRGFWRWLKIAAPVVASVLGLVLLRVFAGSQVDQARVREWIAPLGEGAWVAFVLFLAVRPLTLLPGQLFTAVGGLLFGAVWATIYSLLGSFLASLVIFFLARRVGSRALRRLVGTHYGAVERVTRQSAFRFAFVSCLSPLLPTDVAQAAAFSAGAGFFRVALGVLLGSLPGTFLTAAFGSALGQGKTILTTLTVIGILLSLWLGVWIARRLSREVKAERSRQLPTSGAAGLP
jgi:uncharacterized membrane protein YdjX (TVP38/TMEM64 family)